MINKQFFFVFMFFFIGSTMAFGGNSIAGRDSWISIIIGIILALVMYNIYFKLFDLYDGKSILEINKCVYGNYLGKFINIFYGLIALGLSFISVIMLGFFINTVSLAKTPIIFIIILISITVLILAKSGSMALVRFSEILGVCVIMIIIVSLALSLSDINPTNILPILENGMTDVWKNGLIILILPFLEGFFILSLFYKGYAKNNIRMAIIFAGIIMLLTTFRNLFVFGFPAITMFNYPSYSAVSLINLGDFLQREEVLVSIVFAMCYVFKSAILLNFSSKALFEKKNSKIFISLCVIIVIISPFVGTIMNMFNLILIYKDILIIPLIVIPIITLIISMIKEGKNGTKRIKNRG